MSQPLFISLSQTLLPNWREAFANADLHVGCPSRFDQFDTSLVFLDTQSLDDEQKHTWLDKTLATDRRVIVLSPKPSDQEAITVVQQGAVGYGHTYSAASRLCEMSLVVNHGGLWVGSKLMKRVMGALQNLPTNGADAGAKGLEKYTKTLSEREMSVARHVARGATNLEISGHLNIKERTVKAHITSIFLKLNVRNRVELALLLNDVRLTENPMENSSKRPVL